MKHKQEQEKKIRNEQGSTRRDKLNRIRESESRESMTEDGSDYQYPDGRYSHYEMEDY